MTLLFFCRLGDFFFFNWIITSAKNNEINSSWQSSSLLCYCFWADWSRRAAALCLFVHRCLLGWRRKRASLALLAAFYERCFSHDLFPVWTLCELQAAVWCFRPKWESGCPLMQTRFGLDASHSLWNAREASAQWCARASEMKGFCCFGNSRFLSWSLVAVTAGLLGIILTHILKM